MLAHREAAEPVGNPSSGKGNWQAIGNWVARLVLFDSSSAPRDYSSVAGDSSHSRVEQMELTSLNQSKRISVGMAMHFHTQAHHEHENKPRVCLGTFDFVYRPYNGTTAYHFVKPQQGGTSWQRKSALTQRAVAASWQERSFAQIVAGTLHHQGNSAPATTQAAKGNIHRRGAPITTFWQNERSHLPRRLPGVRGRLDMTRIARPCVYADLDRTITPAYARVLITNSETL